jgi:predicted nucleotidyltransferase
MTGRILESDDEEDVEDGLDDPGRLYLPCDLFEDLHEGDLDAFISTLEDGPIRSKLVQATRGKGGFRRFKDIIFDEGGVEMKHRWEWFETCRKRRCIEEWLESEDIIPDWGIDIYAPPPVADKRCDLICAVCEFVKAARKVPGVWRIALIGSLATPKAIPKDVDLLIGVDDGMPLDDLARLARRLSGATMATGDSCGADVFLHDRKYQYIGRICKWKQCAPGVRNSCRADHCGKRHFLHDDLSDLTLKHSVIHEAPLELWPEVIARTAVLLDVRNLLMEKLDAT